MFVLLSQFENYTQLVYLPLVVDTASLEQGDWVVEYKGRQCDYAENNYTLEFIHKITWIR